MHIPSTLPSHAGLFRAADVDNSGALNRAEFEQILCNAKVGLTNQQKDALLAMTDFNEDGLVEYEYVSESAQGINDVLVTRWRFLEPASSMTAH
jgi:hypothetical protein